MTLSCQRCGQSGEPPPPHRVPLTTEARERVLSSICASCWAQWEDMEVKVINEYRLNFLEPQHRAKLQEVCLDFLNLPA